MHPSAVIATVGVIGIAIAIAGGFGVVPFLSLSNTTGSGTLSPSFAWTSNGVTGVQVTDTSTVGGTGVNVLAVTVSWGDGTPASGAGLHGMVSHTYASSGTYTVGELVTYLLCQGLVCLPQSAVAVAAVATGSTGTSTASVTVSFTFTLSGDTITVVDTTKETGSPLINSVIFAWGDQSTSTGGALGFSASHTYASSGTYNVTDAVSWTSGGRSFLSSSTVDVKVGSVTSLAGWALDSWGAALLFGSVGLLGSQAIPVTRNPAAAVGVAAGAALIGYLLSLVVVI